MSTGWQVVLRSKNAYGPYERKVVMAQGSSQVNGPHQGAWVNTVSGEDWFLHFQDKDAYGRVVHLQPMVWKNDWPVIGVDKDGDGTGEPVMVYKKPATKIKYPVETVQESDEFNSPSLGLQWQWQANPQSGYGFPTAEGVLKMFCIQQPDSIKNYWMLPNILAQKLPAEEFTTITKLSFHPKNINDRTGLIMFGTDYAFISVVKKDSGLFLTYNECINASGGKPEKETIITKLTGKDVWLKAVTSKNAQVNFGYSENGTNFTLLQNVFTAKPGRWVGAKIGLFSVSTGKSNDTGYADIDWFRIEKN